MAESTKAIMSLKKAANYSKLAMREFGPKSYKKGQGALLKVIYKFGDNGSIEKKKAEKILNWCGKNLRHVAKKAEANGYITVTDPEFKFIMALTEKGSEVIKKRLAAEDKAADTVMEALTADEIEQLISLTDKISKNCEELGVDYSKIEKKQHKHHGHHGQHGKEGCAKQGAKNQEKCCHDHGSKYVFVFGDGGHGHCQNEEHGKH